MTTPILTTSVVTISSGASLSPAVQLDKDGAGALVAIVMPSGWDAASITLQAIADPTATTFVNVFDSSGTETTITAAASRYIQLIPTLFAGMTQVKIRSGTSGAPVNQTADRALTLVFRPI